MATHKVEFRGATGALLAARLDTPARPPVAYALFAHCFTCSKNSRAATTISEALAEQGIAVLRFDFTGLGNSDGEFGNTDFASNIEDLLSAADWLDKEHEAPSLLIGHSLGGAAVLAAAKYLTTTRAVATIGAPADPLHVRHLLKPDTDTVPVDGSPTTAINIGGRPFQVTDKFLHDLEEFPVLDLLPELDVATLFFHSPVDETVSFDNAVQLRNAAPRPTSFVSLDTADHLLTNRNDGSYVGSVLGAWARRYLNAPSLDVNPDDPAGRVAEGHVVVAERGAGTFANLVQTPHHHLHVDEPISVPGGTDTGPDPYQLLLASLGACTSMTIRMYADRKDYPLEHVSVDLSHSQIHAKDCEDCESESGKIALISRTVTIEGDLSQEQRTDLLRISDRCPVHKTLTGEIKIETALA